jgi:hypothetical protein
VTSTASPPRLVEAIFRLLLAPHDRESVSGDLLEEYRDSIYPARGRRRADLWFTRQVAAFIWHSNQLWAALLGGAFIARTALDWLVPTVDFHSRSAVSTVLSVGILLCAGFLAGWRSGSPWAGIIAGMATTLIAAIVSGFGAVWLLILYHDPHTMAAIQASGGLEEVFTLPVALVIPGVCLGLLGGLSATAARMRSGGRVAERSE